MELIYTFVVLKDTKSNKVTEFQGTPSRGAYIWRGDLTEGFLRYRFGGLIFGGAYTWGAYFRNFTVLYVGPRRLCTHIRTQNTYQDL